MNLANCKMKSVVLITLAFALTTVIANAQTTEFIIPEE